MRLRELRRRDGIGRMPIAGQRQPAPGGVLRLRRRSIPFTQIVMASGRATEPVYQPHDGKGLASVADRLEAATRIIYYYRKIFRRSGEVPLLSTISAGVENSAMDYPRTPWARR